MNIEFDTPDHANPTECQLIVAITGTKRHIQEQLQRLLMECNDSYGKPRQGIISMGSGSIQIITPIWEGKRF
jgi:hypothetical protein